MTGSWLLRFWAAVFDILSRLSIFRVVVAICRFKSVNPNFVEAYVAANTAAALMSLFIVTVRRDEAVSILFMVVAVYAILRVFEITVYQINVLLFDEYRAERNGQKYKITSYRRIVLLLLHNYLELVAWFGTLYMFLYRSGDILLDSDVGEPTFARVFRESFLMMTTFEPEKNDAGSELGVVLLSIQSVVGLLMTLLMLARFVAMLPVPESENPDEKH